METNSYDSEISEIAKKGAMIYMFQYGDLKKLQVQLGVGLLSLCLHDYFLEISSMNNAINSTHKLFEL
jgi:hypothetical protein